MTNQFFTKSEEYQEKFYQLPKVFFSNEKYKKLSNDAKITYSILRDRLSLSLKNNWVDKNDNIYFIYTNDNLMDILDLGKNKVIKIKKELEEIELLKQTRQGLNKPNLLYLMKPQVNTNDIYQIEQQEKGLETSNGKEVYKTNFQKFKKQTFGSLKNKPQEVAKINSNDTDLNNTDYIETENNDTNDLNDTSNSISTNTHSYHTNHQQTKFNNDALKFQVLEKLPQQIKDYLSNFEIREIRIIKSVLLKGKKSFNNTHDTYYRLEDVEFELVNVLKRFKAMLLQKNETVEAMQSYLMQSIKAELEEIHALNMRRQNMSKYNIFNE